MDPRRERVLAASKAWINQLIDLGASNRLLYYRDLKVGTLDLTPGRATVESVALEQLHSVGRTKLSNLFHDPEDRPMAARRARTIYAKAQENFEERGIDTLHLAWGMATWENPRSAAVPAAPVVLWPLSLAPRSASNEDFDLSLGTDAMINPVLIHLLRSEYHLNVDESELILEGFAENGAEGVEQVFQQLAKEASAVPGFRISDRQVVGNFSYAKLPMVRDLQQELDALVEHDLIAALAGDADAQQAIRDSRSDVSPSSPNETPPEDEFLILDADASQNFAINAAVGGESLIVQGPPGTGKSQTIANLIATYVARGKKVLFVAEKRAAIDAVTKRLKKVGLQDLVMDLHGGATSRRQVAQDLASALHDIGRVPAPELQDLHANLVKRRTELVAYGDALHERRQPWGLSVFEIQSGLLALEAGKERSIRFPREVTQELVPAVMNDARDVLAEYVQLGGLSMGADQSPWARSSVTTAHEAEEAFELARHSKDSIVEAARPLRETLKETGLRRPKSLMEWKQTLALLDEVQETLNVFSEAIFSDDLWILTEEIRPAAKGRLRRAWCRLSSSSYRATRKRLRSHCRDDLKISDGQLYDGAVAALDQRERWGPLATDGGVPKQSSLYGGAESAFESFQQHLRALGAYVVTSGLHDQPPEEVAHHLERLSKDRATLFKLPRLHELRTKLSGWGLTPLVGQLSDSGMDAVESVAALDFAWLSSLYEQIALTDQRIAAFDPDVQASRVEEFRKLDRKHVETTPTRVRRVAAQNAVRARDQYPDENALIEAQARRKRKHLPLRTLFEKAPNLLPALKPCWALSPLLVSQLLPGDKQYFDVAIFDEASQVLPADAIPTFLRAKQVIVAGDDKQLPPTSFFASTVAEDVDTEDDGAGLTEGFESILDVLGALLRPFTLTWHYRSEDERLIAFSNAHLYDKSLTTFPGISSGGCIDHHLVSSPETQPERGTNPAEVRKVVEMVLSHSLRTPQRTLGVIALGIKHADQIGETLRRVRVQHPELENFFDDTREERFFIKNLERVQGDERDSIILSIGYGKGVDGRLRYHFGPLLLQGGERRLNVAITRARKQMSVVSSFDHTDMDPDRSTARGVELLRNYIPFAASGGRDLGESASGIPELNPFEISVRDRLSSIGIPVTPQYGASGYKIDFVAAHPRKPGLLVLAIECDGASYHSSQTARDRDRLRQDVLERLGWRFHRIWSSAWFSNPSLEAERVRAAWQQACTEADHGPRQTADTPGLREETPNSSPLPRARGPKPSLPGRVNIDLYSQQELVSMVRWVESDTLLRTEEQLLEEVMRELGFGRKGSKIVSAITSAIRTARR